MKTVAIELHKYQFLFSRMHVDYSSHKTFTDAELFNSPKTTKTMYIIGQTSVKNYI